MRAFHDSNGDGIGDLAEAQALAGQVLMLPDLDGDGAAKVAEEIAAAKKPALRRSKSRSRNRCPPSLRWPSDSVMHECQRDLA